MSDSSGIAARKKLFLDSLYKSYTILRACQKTKIQRRTINEWMKEDSEFRAEVIGIKEHIYDKVEEIALIKLRILPIDGRRDIHKISDNLIGLYLRRSDNVNVNITGTPAPLSIKGWTQEMTEAVTPAIPTKAEEPEKPEIPPASTGTIQ